MIYKLLLIGWLIIITTDSIYVKQPEITQEIVSKSDSNNVSLDKIKFRIDSLLTEIEKDNGR